MRIIDRKLFEGNLPVTTERQPRALTLDPQNPAGVIYLVLRGFPESTTHLPK